MNGRWLLSVQLLLPLLLGGLTQLISLCHAQETFGECRTPTNEPGTCVHFRNCGYLYDLVQRPLSADDRNLLRQSQCGYLAATKDVLICCRNSEPESSLLPVTPNCGDALEDRIVGGRNAALTEFPWMALIEYVKPGNERGHHCGGSLINERYVVTAAHCVNAIPTTWRLTGVRLGEWDTTTTNDCITQLNGHKVCNSPHIDVPVSQIIVHEQYPGKVREQYNDIALLRLQRPVEYSNTISPVCLPVNAAQRRNMYSGRRLVVAGWGHTSNGTTANIKQKAEVDTVSLSDCNKKYVSQRRTVSDLQICAGGVQGVDSCRGDSGGPLVSIESEDGGQYFYLAGVVSYGPTPCGLNGWPGVYTRVGQYMDWIISHVKP